MAEVKILIDGFTEEKPEKIEKAWPTMTLIRDGKWKIIVDPGTIKDPAIIINGLEKEGIKKNEINMVFLTHSHIDHFRNIGMFPDAKALEYWGIWDKDTVTDRPVQFTKNIKIINTPGHSDDSLTFLVTTKKGVIAICGDVFWKKNYPEIDKYATDFKKLKESRNLILKLADYIIPGHGKIFKVNK